MWTRLPIQRITSWCMKNWAKFWILCTRYVALCINPSCLYISKYTGKEINARIKLFFGSWFFFYHSSMLTLILQVLWTCSLVRLMNPQHKIVPWKHKKIASDIQFKYWPNNTATPKNQLFKVVSLLWLFMVCIKVHEDIKIHVF